MSQNSEKIDPSRAKIQQKIKLETQSNCFRL